MDVLSSLTRLLLLTIMRRILEVGDFSSVRVIIFTVYSTAKNVIHTSNLIFTYLFI